MSKLVAGRGGGEQSHLLGLWKQYSVCLLGMAVLGEASQDGPGQKENKHRFDENVVTPRSREKDAFVLGGRGRGCRQGGLWCGAIAASLLGSLAPRS